MSENNFNEYGLSQDLNTYDFDGLIRFVDSEDAAMILTFEDVDDERHYMNRYEILETYMSREDKLRLINRYLEQDEEHGVFISFAINYNGKLRMLGGKGNNKEVDCGELELGDKMIYGTLVRIKDDNYVFEEVIYFDGDNKNHSWAEQVLDAGELTGFLEEMILEFS